MSAVFSGNGRRNRISHWLITVIFTMQSNTLLNTDLSKHSCLMYCPASKSFLFLKPRVHLFLWSLSQCYKGADQNGWAKSEDGNWKLQQRKCMSLRLINCSRSVDLMHSMHRGISQDFLIKTKKKQKEQQLLNLMWWQVIIACDNHRECA